MERVRPSLKTSKLPRGEACPDVCLINLGKSVLSQHKCNEFNES